MGETLNLYEVAKSLYREKHAAKPLPYYYLYDEFLTKHELRPKSIVEIGVHEGESLRILSQAFPNANILGIDLKINRNTLPHLPNVIFQEADQNRADVLSKVVADHFPEGIDLVIDDASHFGEYSRTSFFALFPFLKSGGAYFIEDWGTGYWETWPDGNQYRESSSSGHKNGLKHRIISHDYGMVGFVKSLVDLTHETAIQNGELNSSVVKSRLKSLEFAEGVVMALKA